jgi:hypothetical protein
MGNWKKVTIRYDVPADIAAAFREHLRETYTDENRLNGEFDVDMHEGTKNCECYSSDGLGTILDELEKLLAVFPTLSGTIDVGNDYNRKGLEAIIVFKGPDFIKVRMIE